MSGRDHSETRWSEVDRRESGRCTVYDAPCVSPAKCAAAGACCAGEVDTDQGQVSGTEYVVSRVDCISDEVEILFRTRRHWLARLVSKLFDDSEVFERRARASSPDRTRGNHERPR